MDERKDEMKKTLYLECYAGISGDMTVAALLDLGANPERLKSELTSLSVDGYEVEISRVEKSGLDACDFAVKTDEAHATHDHDMEYLHGDTHDHEDDNDHEDGHDHKHAHEDSHDHKHDHDHKHKHKRKHGHDHEDTHEHDHTHHHAHRGLPEIRSIIEGSRMSEGAKATALKIFEILARAEAKAHGVPVDEVHFHEVGAIDSIVDVAATAICLDDLDVGEVIIPMLCEGKGTIRCQHGIIPIPAPATLNIVTDNHLNLQLTDVEGEFVTPTGAAIAAAIATSDRLPEHFRVVKTGLGAGKRSYEKPSILRAMIIESEDVAKSADNNMEETPPEVLPSQGDADEKEASPATADGKPEAPTGGTDAADRILKLECNVDDCSGEALGYAMERLFAAGAKDVSYAPVYMKKNRPGWLITVICDIADREAMEAVLFAETTTIGIRRQEMERSVLPRKNRSVATSLGEVSVKVAGGRAVPEYESVAKLARENGLSYIEAGRIIEMEV